MTKAGEVALTLKLSAIFQLTLDFTLTADLALALDACLLPVVVVVAPVGDRAACVNRGAAGKVSTNVDHSLLGLIVSPAVR